MLLEEILAKENMHLAYRRVKTNKGSHGIDGMSVDELAEFLKKNWPELKTKILEGTYKPQPVRRVEIPKPEGGVRLLGIPTVLDRLLQQAIYQKLEPIFDPTFSANSYGFRKGKNAKQAVLKAQTYQSEGYSWVVDLDLEKFFDRVNHDILMSRLARKVEDKRVLKIIRAYLNAGVMLNGVVLDSLEGTPQGGNLSPLLANIILDELDKELEKRGHKFCRYADDCNIYVKSKRAGARVMESICHLIEKKLKLKVNKDKSAVDRPAKRKFLGFSFYTKEGGTGIRVHEKSLNKLKVKLKAATGRSRGISIEARFSTIRELIIGWINYYGIADMKSKCQELDEWLRRRIRMCIWKQWKKLKTRFENLSKLGVTEAKAWEWANTRKGYWRIAGSAILSTTLTTQVLEKMGLVGLTSRYKLVQP